MKAIVYSGYGSADVIQHKEVDRPIPKADEILVKVVETIVTPSDIAARKGEPYLIRLFSGLTRPRAIPGSDLAGVVAAVGPDVTEFRVGQRVFGAVSPATGTHAEYVAVPESGVVAVIPDDLDFAATAGICDAAMTALTFLRDVGHIEPGQSLLINGASGAIGTFAVQLAKHFGATVTGVCSGANVDLVRSLGADMVVDYTQMDFARTGRTYDIIFDAVGKSSYRHCHQALTPTGFYLTTVPGLGILLQMALTTLRRGRRARFAATGLNQTKEKLLYLRQLLASGKLRSVVDRKYPLSEIAAAHRYVEKGHKKGNIIIALDEA